MFIDLEDATNKSSAFCGDLPLQESKLKGPYITAVGGHVICPEYTPTVEQVHQSILQALGEGSLLTFGNPNCKSRKDYAVDAIKHKHLWALRAFTLTVLYVDVPRVFRDDCAFSRRFHMSWNEIYKDPVVFTAQGSLRDWRKFLAHKNDKSYREVSRQLMQQTYDIMNKLSPELFEAKVV